MALFVETDASTDGLNVDKDGENLKRKDVKLLVNRSRRAIERAVSW